MQEIDAYINIGIDVQAFMPNEKINVDKLET